MVLLSPVATRESECPSRGAGGQPPLLAKRPADILLRAEEAFVRPVWIALLTAALLAPWPANAAKPASPAPPPSPAPSPSSPVHTFSVPRDCTSIGARNGQGFELKDVVHFRFDIRHDSSGYRIFAGRCASFTRSIADADLVFIGEFDGAFSITRRGGTFALAGGPPGTFNFPNGGASGFFPEFREFFASIVQVPIHTVGDGVLEGYTSRPLLENFGRTIHEGGTFLQTEAFIVQVTTDKARGGLVTQFRFLEASWRKQVAGQDTATRPPLHPRDPAARGRQPRRPPPGRPAQPPGNGPPTDPGQKGDRVPGRSGDDDRGHGLAKIAIRSLTDFPDPLQVGNTATFLLQCALRTTDALNALDHRSPQGDRHTFLVRVRIGLTAPTGETVTLTQDVPITPPLGRRRLPGLGGHFVIVGARLLWDGRFPGAT